MRKVFLLALVVFVSLMGCNSGSNSHSSLKNLKGYWDGVLVDSKLDTVKQPVPDNYVFLDISYHQGDVFSGHFYRQTAAGRDKTFFMGYANDDRFEFSVNTGNDQLNFSGNFNSKVYEIEKEHFLADWTSSDGSSGTVIFTSTDSHIEQGATSAPSLLKGNEFYNLTKDGGSGQPIIFVHGLMSSPASWDDMIEKLREEGYFKKYEFWRFGYDTRQPFEVIGLEMYEQVKNAGLLPKKPILVAHSMGGLVSRSYIASGGTFSLLITLDSPHCGTPEGAGGIFTGPGTIEMISCSPSLVNLYLFELSLKSEIEIALFFSKFSIVSGKITGRWKWVEVHKCLSKCPPVGPCCTNGWVYTWVFDRNYNSLLKAGWFFIVGTGYGDNDGAVPTASSAFCVSSTIGWKCDICPPISSKLETNCDHFMLQDPSKTPDVYEFVKKHLGAPISP